MGPLPALLSPVQVIDKLQLTGKKPCENLKFKRVEIMKKSKFLKKSLAMLLALMLVVAMIPLSASAASINLDYIYVNDGPVQLGGTIRPLV